MKSIVALRLARSTVIAHRDHRAGVHLVAVFAVVRASMTRRTASSALSWTWPHVGLHDVEAEVVDHLADLVDALLVGGDLRAQVGEVGVRVAGRVRRLGEQPAASPFRGTGRPRRAASCRTARPPRAIVVAVRGHGAGGEPADLGVVAAGGDEEEDALARGVEDRGDHGDVGQVGAAVVRVVDRVHVARASSCRPRRRMTSLTLVPIEPRCTGMCGALATGCRPGRTGRRRSPAAP